MILKEKKVAIFFYEGYLSAAPTLLNLSSYLSENGFYVKLFTRKIQDKYNNDLEDVSFNIEFIDDYLIFFRTIFTSIITKLLKKKYRKKYDAIKYILDSFFFFNYPFQKKYKDLQFDILIGVDPIGLIAANKFHTKLNKIIYLSLEIDYLFNNTNIYTQWIKKREIKIHKKSNYTIIQDIVRLKYLCFENGIDYKHLNYFLLPNSPRPEILNSTQSNYFRELFSLSDNSFIVLSAGMISDQVFSLEIAKSLNSLDENIELVFHERRNIDIRFDTFLNSLLQLNVSNLHLSLKPVAYNKISSIYSSADIGLAIYNPQYGINYSNILFASGKISHYLKYGKPIIVNDLNGMKEFINETQCGVVIKDINDINSAILEIKENYLFYSNKAYDTYSKYFNFDIYCSKIVSALFDYN
jgi:glycosyltransferase involved in cell wall biosynthesis